MSLRKILLATDFSDASRAGVRRASMLAAGLGAEVVALYAFDASGYKGSAEVLAEERNGLQLALDGVCGELARDGVAARGMLVEGHADEVIVESARVEAADLVIVGAHGRTGLRRLIIGSVAEKVVRTSDIPVLVARGEATAFARILVATDFSEHAERALDLALALAAPQAAVNVVHFVQLPGYAADTPGALPRPTMGGDLEADFQRRGEALFEPRRRAGLELRFQLDHGGARDGILGRIDDGGHELVALGSHGRRGLRRFLLGSVAEGLVRQAPCSVLVSR